MQKNLTSNTLVVLEYPYQYAAWCIDPDHHETVISERKPFVSGRRATEDYRLCGVYGKAGVPYEIIQIDGSPYPDLEPYQAIPLHFSKVCEEAAREGKKILISSGYCAFAPAVLGGLQQGLGTDKKIGVVWMDAHCDNVIAESSERDLRFVGVPLSTIAGQTMEAWGREYCRMDHPCAGEHILVGDGRLTDEEGLRTLAAAGIRRVPEERFEDSEYWKQQIDALADRVDYLFLMVDADIMNGKCIPAYFCPEPGGHDVAKVMENIRIVMNTGKVAAFSCFCIDFDKYEMGRDITYLNGMRLIGAGLESWKD